MKRKPETLFRHFSTHQFLKLRATRTFARNMPEFRIARRDATDNGRRKYYTSVAVFRLQFSLIRGFGGLLKKLSARLRRQSSQSARSAASNRDDKSEAESHLRSVRVSQKISKLSPRAIFNIKRKRRVGFDSWLLKPLCCGSSASRRITRIHNYIYLLI